MAQYQYKARDKFGNSATGVIDADSESDAASKLKKIEYTPVLIKQAILESAGIRFQRKLKFCDLNMFNRQFYILLRAGLPVISGLTAVKQQTTNPVLKSVLDAVIKDIEGGLSLSAAFKRHPNVFDTIYVNMIECGEASGTLDTLIERLTSIGEHQQEMRMKISGALRYPIIVVCSIIAGFSVLIVLVVPRFANIYAQMSGTLPLPTLILLGINYAITRYWWLIILSAAAIILSLKHYVKTKKGRLWWDTQILKVPVFGPLILKFVISRFSRITAILMRSGVSILKVLQLASEGSGNARVSLVIDDIRKSVNEGRGITEPMKASGIFPPVVIQMVHAGEQTGKVDELLLHISDYYDTETRYTINNFISLIEPILIFFLGSMVLLMALGILLPMWNMLGLFRK